MRIGYLNLDMINPDNIDALNTVIHKILKVKSITAKRLIIFHNAKETGWVIKILIMKSSKKNTASIKLLSEANFFFLNNKEIIIKNARIKIKESNVIQLYGSTKNIAMNNVLVRTRLHL